MAGVLGELEHRVAGDALEDVVVDGRRHDDTVTDHEQVRGRCLGGVAAGREHERLVEAVELGLALLERHVHVPADDLAPCGECLVRVPTPGRAHDPDAAGRVDVVAERDRDDVQLVLQVVEPDPDRARALVERRADVRVLAELVAADGLEDDRAELVDRLDRIHEQDAGRLADPLHVLPDEQPVELLLLGVPVGADPLERRSPVHERVGHDADVRVAHRDVGALEVADEVVEVPGAAAGAGEAAASPSGAAAGLAFSVSIRGRLPCCGRADLRPSIARSSEPLAQPPREIQGDEGDIPEVEDSADEQAPARHGAPA